jgi:aerobic-type carbon monoxide dehydrogenase small subunit (CoxS/CutS family)
MITLNINGRTHSVEVDPSTPLLWVLRDTLALTGTKFGCGIAQCGACTVHIDGAATGPPTPWNASQAVRQVRLGCDQTPQSRSAAHLPDRSAHVRR